MGAKVVRYSPHGYSVGMRATHEGDYVRWHDYEALEAKLREARGLVADWRLRAICIDGDDCADELAAILGANDA